MFDVLSYYLSNGMRVLLHREPNSRVIKTGIIVSQGSSNESDDNNGISHFLEHMLVADNEENPKIHEYKEELRKHGAVYNATTYKSSTMYYVVGLESGSEKYIDFLKEIVFQNRNFLEKNVNKEKKIVERELSSYYANFNQISDRAIQALYGEKDIGRIIVGKRENVLGFEIAEMEEILNRTYTPENTALVVFGDFDYYKMNDIIERKFASLDDRTTEKLVEPVQNTPSIYFNPHYSGENSIVSVCFRKTSALNKELIQSTMNVLVTAMSNPTLTDRIGYGLRFENNLAYQIGGFVSNLGHCNAAGITAIGKTRDVADIVKYALEQFEILRIDGFEEEELERVKQHMVMQKLCEKRNLTTQADLLLKLARDPMIYSPDNEIRLIEKLQLQDINKCLQDILQPENFGLACIGNCDINTIANMFSV